VATEEEIWKYVLEVEGEAEARKLGAATDRARDATGKFVSSLTEEEREAAKAAKAVRAAGEAATSAGAASGAAAAQVRSIGAAFSVSTNKLQVFAQGLDDLQYVPEQGLRPILNNLVQLSPALGIAALGVSVLYAHSGELANLFGKGATRTEAEQMEELGKKTSKTADETQRLAKYEELRKNIKAQQEGKPEAQTKAAEAVNKAIVEGPLDEINKGVDKHFGDRIRAMAETDPAYEAAARFKKDFGSAGDAPQLDAAGRKVISDRDAARNKANQAKADDDLNAIYGRARERFLGGLATKPDAARAVERAARENPGDFGPGGAQFARSLRDGTPEAARKAAEREARNVEEEEALKGQADLAARQEKAREKAAADEKAVEKLYEDMDEENARAGKEQKKEVIDRAGRLTAGQGFGAQVDSAFVRNALGNGGDLKKAASDLVEQIASELRARGLGAKDALVAAEDLAAKHAAKIGDEVVEKAMKGPETQSIDHVGAADYARSIEAGGSKDSAAIAANTATMIGQLSQLINKNPTLGQ
jgi:hypothetical protein